MCVNDYAKLTESLLLKVNLQFESEEEKVARFVSELRREIQYVIELYEYFSLENFLPLALKGETQLGKRNEAKRSSYIMTTTIVVGKQRK